MMKDKSKDLLEVGVVVGTHGLKGDLKIRPLPTGDLALPGARTVYLRNSEGLPVRHEAVRSSLHKQNILLRLSGLENLAAVEGLTGASVWMDNADLPELADDQFYWSDLEGLVVIDRQQGDRGIGHCRQQALQRCHRYQRHIAVENQDGVIGLYVGHHLQQRVAGPLLLALQNPVDLLIVRVPRLHSVRPMPHDGMDAGNAQLTHCLQHMSEKGFTG